MCAAPKSQTSTRPRGSPEYTPDPRAGGMFGGGSASVPGRAQVAAGWNCADQKACLSLEAGLETEAGDGLLSHEVSLAVPSALTGLTSVFGMGTGVALSL